MTLGIGAKTPPTVILFEGPSGYTRARVRVVVTGLARGSKNSKTGRMPQVWFLPIDRLGRLANEKGDQLAVCGACPMLPRRHGGQGGCYVNKTPLAGIVRASGKVDVPRLDMSAIGDVAALARWVGSRAVRIGAWGDPSSVPAFVIAGIAKAGKVGGRTGYTHGWRDLPLLAGHAMRRTVMASVESPAGAREAHARGWRTFRVRPLGAPLMVGEIECPASDRSGHRTTCAQCGLCDGARAYDRRANISIEAHGGAVIKGGRASLPILG